MIGQNYERAGEEPVGLHTLMARPALEATAATVFDSRSVVEAVNRVAGSVYPGSQGAPAAQAGAAGAAGESGSQAGSGPVVDGVGAR